MYTCGQMAEVVVHMVINVSYYCWVIELIEDVRCTYAVIWQPRSIDVASWGIVDHFTTTISIQELAKH